MGKFKEKLHFMGGKKSLKSAIIICKGQQPEAWVTFSPRTLTAAPLPGEPPAVLSVPWSYWLSPGDQTLTGWLWITEFTNDRVCVRLCVCVCALLRTFPENALPYYSQGHSFLTLAFFRTLSNQMSAQPVRSQSSRFVCYFTQANVCIGKLFYCVYAVNVWVPASVVSVFFWSCSQPFSGC